MQTADWAERSSQHHCVIIYYTKPFWVQLYCTKCLVVFSILFSQSMNNQSLVRVIKHLISKLWLVWWLGVKLSSLGGPGLCPVKNHHSTLSHFFTLSTLCDIKYLKVVKCHFFQNKQTKKQTHNSKWPDSHSVIAAGQNAFAAISHAHLDFYSNQQLMLVNPRD